MWHPCLNVTYAIHTKHKATMCWHSSTIDHKQSVESFSFSTYSDRLASAPSAGPWTINKYIKNTGTEIKRKRSFIYNPQSERKNFVLCLINLFLVHNQCVCVAMKEVATPYRHTQWLLKLLAGLDRYSIAKQLTVPVPAEWDR